MRQTWRWFGPADLVPIDAVVQAGAEGVVTSLHHVPPGAVWRPDEIARRQAEVGRMADGTPSGLRWEVVESLPVSEAIKTQTGPCRAHLDAYRRSLCHLAAAGIEVVCYNFMPVLDWTRTDLAHRLPNGATCMRFDLTDFAVFDIHLLARPGAAEDYGAEVQAEAVRRHSQMSDDARADLVRTLVTGLPGAAEHWTLDDVRTALAAYARIDADRLRAYLMDFLAEVVPEAERLGLRLCAHPDDPPFPLLGLPRILSTEADYAALVTAVPSAANGITLCTGSLGVRADVDLPGMMARLGPHVHFLHLRNTRRDPGPAEAGRRASFIESAHLDGDTDMVAVVAAALREEARRRAAGRADSAIPFRPDHGQDILDDLSRATQPGYPAIGRLKGLAELRGVIAGLSAAAADPA